MRTSARLRRYLLLLERMRRPCSFAELCDHLDQYGLKLSHRTLHRDIEQIRDELGAEVVYDRPSNTYQLQGPHEAMARTLQLLERAVLGTLLQADASGIGRASQHVIMEHHGRLSGLAHWPVLLRAIDERRMVRVDYRRFQSERDQHFELRPHFLKEYQGRWYVLGMAAGYDRPISLGLDRIVGLHSTTQRVPAKEKDMVRELYTHVIGVDTSGGEPRSIRLKFTVLQGRYVKALPLHPSQQMIQDDADGCVVDLFVVPNMELEQALLALGSSVEVVRPAGLAGKLRRMHAAAGLRKP